MSYDPRLASRPYGDPEDGKGDAPKKGSVRAARERLQAARMQEQLPDRSRIIGLPQRPNQLVSNLPTQSSQRTQPQENLSPVGSQTSGNAFAQSPQWPLPNDAADMPDSKPTQNPRGPPPPRPPRPVIEEPISPGQNRSSYQSDDVFSPTSARSSRPLTTSSFASDTSSLGDIPDFPIPQPPMPTIQPLPRRQPSLGPPPSARRGPSSYYTQMSYVSPIAEESETRSDIIRSHHGSFASSMAIPPNVNDYYAEDDIRSDDDDDETITSFDMRGDERRSTMSDHDDRSELVTPSLVREASMGRRTKPSLMTIRSVEGIGERKGSSKMKPVTGENAGVGAAGIGGAILAAREGISGRAVSGATDSGFPGQSSSSNETLNTLRNTDSRTDSQRVLDFEKENMDEPVHPLQRQRSRRQPPLKLDMEAVRDAEARGSLTSLPELIRRATRLAANLDRGRTASRLGLDFWEQGAPPDKHKSELHRSGSLSDMLAAFPPPGEATPTGPTTPNPKGMDFGERERAGDTTATESAFSEPKQPPKKRRRCCGMPLWTFVIVLIVLLFLVAAAVIIPIVLIVVPRMKASQTPAMDTTGNNAHVTTLPTAAPTVSTPPGQCDGLITCQNGGVAIPQSDRTCNCVCINGFTGKTCATKSDAGCTTTDIAGTAENATVGTGIPRLISSARTNFGVSLDASQLLSLFSNLGLSCTAENALITFNGLASRSMPIVIDELMPPTRSLALLEEPQLHGSLIGLQPRQAIGQVNAPNVNAATPTASSPPLSTVPVSSDPRALDFARISVLLVLQQSRTLDTAANAQVTIQDFLTDDRNGNGNTATTLNLGNVQLDLRAFTLKFQNGTTIRARPQSSGS